MSCQPIRYFFAAMSVTSFLDQVSALEVSVTLQPMPADEPRPEVVKIHLVGSLKGIRTITHSLHTKRFAEVREWSRPQPTTNPGEYISILFKHVWLE